MLEAIYIPRLAKAFEQTETIEFQQFIQDLETLTPVRGRLTLRHGGNYLEVTAQAETIVTLTCYRCLQQYNHRLKIQPTEIICLDETGNGPDEGPLEREIALEELVETLSAQGTFDPEAWLYEQICLEIPSRQLCDADCPGIEFSPGQGSPLSVGDRRWAQALEQLKKQLPS